MKKKLLLLAVTLLCSSWVGADSITSLIGDIDGFGFSSTTGLNSFSGDPADTNGNGILEPGEFLPDLNGDGRYDPASPSKDLFNNQEAGDPSFTDIGLGINPILTLDFSYILPTGHTITSASFHIVMGDSSFAQRNSHIISLEGVSTGEIVASSSTGDGNILETIVNFDSFFFAALADGNAQVTISYDNTDDVAIDYALLQLETTVPEPSSLGLLLLAFLGVILQRNLIINEAT